jgi:DNA-binding response OmpR family regulator
MTSPTANSRCLASHAAILLVEDEPVLRAAMVRGLAKLANVEVLVATTVAEAVALVRSNAPSLVISDLDLPGPSGLELIDELQRRSIDIPIILVTAYLKTYRAQIPNHPNVLVLEKPIPLKELRARVVAQLVETADNRSVQPARLPPPTRRDTTVTAVLAPKPVFPPRLPPPSSHRPITAEVPLDPEEETAAFERLWVQGVDALLSRKLDVAASFFQSANQLRPDQPRVTANLRRLKEMGYDQPAKEHI